MSGTPDLDSRRPALDIATKQGRLQRTFRLSTGVLSQAIEAAAPAAERAAAALWRRDPATWSTDGSVQDRIAKRLGWLDSPELMADSLERLQAFASGVKDNGFTDVVLLGMGGSSLAPEVLRAVLGGAPGWPRLHMLDSTDPAAVRAVQVPLAHTLFLLASKSGTTIEPNSLAAYFRAELETLAGQKWADHFVAITDGGTELERIARAEKYRDLFINPSDIGGRYSALSFFGLVPAALMGQSLAGLLGWGLAMLAASKSGAGIENPAVGLGLAMGAAARAGRDKLTLLLPPALEPFGLWVEQLVAESTGKNGAGIVPIAGEPLADAAAYGADRLFVRLRLHGAYSEEVRDAHIRDLEATGAPVVEIDLPEPSALGAEFARWEVATAVAGALLGVNPFDEPNVQQAKDATRVLLNRYETYGELPNPPSDRTTEEGTTLAVSSAARKELFGRGPEAILTLLKPGDYFALLAYLGPDAALAAELQAFRNLVRDRTGTATMFGYGPRYLHSTGQLHKGGPNTGVFVLISAVPERDLPIPGGTFTFGTLELAQAFGDFSSLDTTGRRAIHVHLPTPDRHLLHKITSGLLERLQPRAPSI